MSFEFEIWMAWALGAFFLIAILIWQGKKGSRRAKRRARRAVRGEERAKKLLKAHGYHILDDQVSHCIEVEVDGSERTYDIRADFLVRRQGRTYVAEVKTGKIVPNLSHGPTRRQLLEYTLAYNAVGTLLVLPEDGKIHAVRFPGRYRRLRSPWPYFILGIFTGIFATATYLG